MPGFERTPSNAPRAAAPFEDATDRSGTFRSVSPTQSLSAKFWGLDLRANLPRVLSHDGVEAVPGEIDRVRAFLAEEFSSFAEEALGMNPSASMTRAKLEYLTRACDSIELRHMGQTVGVLVGAPEDWSSYYVRLFAVKHTHQRPALIRRFVKECLFAPLAAHHVERIVAETSPANLAMSRLFSELHFHVTGHQLSERWGPLVRYSKFLDENCEAAFHKRFAGTAPPSANRSRKEGRP